MTVEKLMRKISADGWKEYLGGIGRSNTRSLFAYLAKEEGRHKWGLSPADLAPLKLDGQVVVGPRRKCEALAEAFCAKLTAPAESQSMHDGTYSSAQPLPRFREDLKGTPKPISELGVLKAAKGLAKRKTPGPDGLPVIPFVESPPIRKALVTIYNAIMSTGAVPVGLARIYMVPLLKAGKDPNQCSSRRPISLISTVMKIFEAIIYFRILEITEGRLDPCQYAYRRERGTELLLTVIGDFIHRSLNMSRYVYAVSFDVAAAFDKVPHRQLMAALENHGIDGHTRRIVHNWLRGRTF